MYPPKLEKRDLKKNPAAFFIDKESAEFVD